MAEEQIFAGRKLTNGEGSPIFGCGLVQASSTSEPDPYGDESDPQVSTVDEHHSIFGNKQTRHPE